MGCELHHFDVDDAFGRIEETILPSLSHLLDGMIDAAAFCRPGIDAEEHAEMVRAMARQIESLTREVEALAPAAVQPAEPIRIPA